MIFNKYGVKGAEFVRKLELHNDVIIVTDKIRGLPRKASLYRAGRSSARHVASADSFHFEDFMAPSSEISFSEERKEESDSVVVVSTYRLT